MSAVFAGLAAAGLLLLSIPAFRAVGKRAPRLLYAQPVLMTGLSGAATYLVLSALGLPMLLSVIAAVLVALPTGYWGCKLMLDELLRDLRF